ncbi:MAG: mannitol dehydrogenase family protein [Clostridiales bacterium]|jgi:fructuronate reductase|nr:mannitol dehydrogenase family protein [Clostridiales bacterium]
MQKSLEINKTFFKQRQYWQEIGVSLPKFEYEVVKQNSIKNPTWIHFGVGNIFRGFVARLQQDLLNQQKADTGILGVLTSDTSAIDFFKIYDNITLLVTLNFDGSVQRELIASLTNIFHYQLDYQRLIEVFLNPSLQIVSFTITEKGYNLFDENGQLQQQVAKDVSGHPAKAEHTLSVVTALLLQRYLHGQHPISLLSLDNCSDNGDKLKVSILTIANLWIKKGFATKEFGLYLQDIDKVSYPLSMIDKITPSPSKALQQELKSLDIQNISIFVSSRKTLMAPFVNAEKAEYLCIEDSFANGRPKLEFAGVYFADRKVVKQVENMKVTTCLNPLHTALAVFGCLFGYKSIAEEMKDQELVKLIKKIGYDEGLKVVVDPQIIDPKQFIDEVIERRLPNPFIPDTPQRIAIDTSQKVGIRFGETIKTYINKELDTKMLVGIPLTLAGWLRYLLGVDDNLEKMILSPDPMLDKLTALLSEIRLGDKKLSRRQLFVILSNKTIFGVDLYQANLGEKIEDYFEQMIEGKGAVRSTLIKYLKG